MSERIETWTVWCIAELWCCLEHFAERKPTGHDLEDCLQAHRDAGIDHVVWKLGRGAEECVIGRARLKRGAQYCQ